MNKEWVNHIEKSKRMSSEPLHKAFRQYGTHNFMIKELDECNESEVIEKTNYWISKYHPEYNPPIEKLIETVKKEEYKPPITDTRSYSHLIPLNDQTRGNGKHCGLRIKGKNLETGIVTEYENARIAATQVTGDPNKNANILRAARSNGVSYGHKWQIVDDKDKKKSVFGVNKKTEQIEIRYESIAEAVRQLRGSGQGAGLIKSLRNPGRYSWRGYYWFYSR